MSIRDFFARFFRETPEKKIKKLLKQLDQAMSDLQIRIADSIARSSGLTRSLNEESEQLQKLSSDDIVVREPIETRIESIDSALEFEKKAENRMRQIYEDLKNRQQPVVIHLITEEGSRDISFFHFYFFGGNWMQLSCTFARYVFPFWNE